MQIIRCENNKHFYDADLYDTCPHCGKEQQSAVRPVGKDVLHQRPDSAKPSEKQAVHDVAPPSPPLQKPGSDLPPSQNAVSSQELKKSSHVFCTNCGKAMPITKRFCTVCGTKLRIPELLPEQDDQLQKPPNIKLPDGNHTSSIWEQTHDKKMNAPDGATAIPPTPDTVKGVSETPVVKRHEPQILAGNNLIIPDETVSQSDFPLPQPVKAEPPQEEDNKDGDLQQAVAAVTSHSASEDAKTVAFYDFGNEESPLVGWLVCVKGEYLGQGFELKSGQNYIGRAQNMSIALARESSVSRHRHANIIFDPIKNVFYIQQGESSGLTYLNGELVMEHVQLNSYDIIRLGNAEFVFLPFCGDRFSWDNYMRK